MLSLYLSMLDSSADKSFIEQLYIEYERELFSAAYPILKNNTDAEDAVHEAFLSVIKNIDKLRTFSCHELRLYMIVIVRNAAKRIYNKRKKLNECDMDEFYDIESDLNVEEQVLSNISFSEIMWAMKELSDYEYELLYLHVVREYKPRDIAELMGISGDNARQQIHRARMKLIKILGERGIGNGK